MPIVGITLEAWNGDDMYQDRCGRVAHRDHAHDPVADFRRTERFFNTCFMNMARNKLLLIALANLLSAMLSKGQATGDVEIRRDLQYAIHDGVALTGDFYAPKDSATHPVVIAIHGGGWQLGSRTADYQYWGSY